MLKIKELPTGMIVWRKKNILGIVGATLPNEYYDCYCIKVTGNNEFDYELVENVED